MQEHSRRTVTEQRSKRWREDLEPVDAVRSWSASTDNQEHELDPEETTYVCGAHPDCAIVIDDPHVSSQHATFELRSNRTELRVRRIETAKNGIRLRGERRAQFDVTCGQPFNLGRAVTVLPMSAAMRTARRRLFNVYGGRIPELPVDKLLIEALGNGNILILGSPGCGHQELALAVHAVSPRGDLSPEVLKKIPTDPTEQQALVERAARSTVVLSMTEKTSQLRTRFVEDLESIAYETRVIAHAPSLTAARRVFGAEVVGRWRDVLLRPLRKRLEELPQVFDNLLAAQESTVRWEHLHADHQAGLRQYSWPGDFDELAEVATWVAAIAPSPTEIIPVAQAAQALELGRTDLYDKLERVGLANFWKSLDAEKSRR